MARKRRKLNSDLEKQIASAKRKVELITAIINDIEDDDIQKEYKMAFQASVVDCLTLSNLYDEVGFNQESEQALELFKSDLNKFETEYEI